MTAKIIDLATVRVIRDLDTLNDRADHLRHLAGRQRAACHHAATRLESLQAGLNRFADRLDRHRRRCEVSARCLKRATDALESDDIDRMIAARDDLAHRMGPAGARACRPWPAARGHHL